jgi:hypothetical protein
MLCFVDRQSDLSEKLDRQIFCMVESLVLQQIR